jgi:putative transposase
LLSFTARAILRPDEPFCPESYLFITTGTFQKRPFIAGNERKTMLLESLDFNCYKAKWRLLAFVLLENHYHVVVQTPPGDPSRLAHVIQSANSFCAYHWRREDPTIRSRIWWNFWDMPIADLDTLRKLINYLHANPQRHGVAANPADYLFSSYPDYLKNQSDVIRRWEREHPASLVSLPDNF